MDLATAIEQLFGDVRVQDDFGRQCHRHLRRINRVFCHGITLALAKQRAIAVEIKRPAV